MAAPLRFGLQVPQEYSDPGLLREIAGTAEQCGYHSLWVYDHLVGYPSPSNATLLEAWTTMSLLAGWTTTIRIGALVLCNSYRNPALTAKMAASLDVLSGGRLEFGYGAGWHRDEYLAYGYDFPSAASRVEMMEEALEIITQLWTGEPTTVKGTHHRVVDAVCQPRPVQRPRPPITIGGGGERRTLRAVARYADIWNYFPVPLLEYERKLEVLHEHCRAIDRSPDTIDQSLLVPIVTARWEKEVRDQLEEARRRGIPWAQGNHFVQGTPDIVGPRLRDYVRRGVSFFIVALPDPSDVKQIEFVSRSIIADLMDQ